VCKQEVLSGRVGRIITLLGSDYELSVIVFALDFTILQAVKGETAWEHGEWCWYATV